MTTVWFVCMAVGLLVAIISLIGGAIGDIDIDLDADIDLDTGIELDTDVNFDFVPISIKSISLGIVFYGAVSILVFSKLNSLLISNLVGVITGYVGAVLVQNFIKLLKRHQTVARDESYSLYSEATVVNRIAENGFGTITVFKNVKNDSFMNYTAKEEDGKSVEQNTKVKIISIEKGVATVQVIE